MSLKKYFGIFLPGSRACFEEPLLNQIPDGRVYIRDVEQCLEETSPASSEKSIKSLIVLIVLLAGWAGVAEVDEITKGEGKVVPSRQLQVLQSLDGGMISEILVKEGDTIKTGQVLVRIDSTRFVSSFRESRATHLGLLAKAARLRAVAEGAAFIPPPEVVRENPALVEDERRLMESRNLELMSQLSIAKQQLSQRNHELSEVRARYEQAARGLELASRELAMTRPLIQSGAVSDVELLRIERDVARYQGDKNQSAAQITRLQAAVGEASKKIEEVELGFKNNARTELAETNAKISSMEQGSAVLSDKVKQADIRSPVNGTVKRLLFNTVGGVVQPGREILEVVPLEDALLLEAKILPKDIGFLRPGQKARVKFTAYDFAVYGGVDAILEHIAADSVVDEKGNAFYIVRVRTPSANLGPSLPVIPGMMAEVDILTGKKTVLSYLLKPVLRAKQYALTER